MKKTNLYSWLIISTLIASCGKSEKPVTETKAKSKENLDSLTLAPNQLGLVNVDLVKFEARKLKPIIFANGVITLLPESKAKVSSQIEGKIEQIFVREGMRVHKGQPLLKISSFHLLELQNDYAAANSEVEFLQIEYNRQDQLRKSNIGVLADFQAVDAKLKAATAKEKALKSKLELIGISTENLLKKQDMKLVSYLTITAPIDGYIYKFYENIGSLVKLETLLAEIINPDKMQADVFIFEKEADLVEEGQAVKVTFVNRNIEPVLGKIAYISRAIDEKTKAITLHVNFNRPHTKEVILSDMNVKVEIAGISYRVSENTLPRTAIFDDGDAKFIFCTSNQPKDAALKFRKYRIEILHEDEEFMEVKTIENLPKLVQIANKNVLALEAERKKRE